MTEPKQVGGPLPPARGKPKWQVDLEKRSEHARSMRVTQEQGLLLTPEGNVPVAQLRAEHARYKLALEQIAAGATAQVAQEALGQRRSYAELMEQNRELEQLVELQAGTLEAIRLGHIDPASLPPLATSENVEDAHVNEGDHPTDQD